MPTKRKAEPKGLVVTVGRFGYGLSVVAPVAETDFRLICTRWLKRAGWRPTKGPAKWRVTFERVEEE